MLVKLNRDIVNIKTINEIKYTFNNGGYYVVVYLNDGGKLYGINRYKNHDDCRSATIELMDSINKVELGNLEKSVLYF